MVVSNMDEYCLMGLAFLNLTGTLGILDYAGVFGDKSTKSCGYHRT